MTTFKNGKEAHKYMEDCCPDFHDADLFWHDGALELKEYYEGDSRHQYLTGISMCDADGHEISYLSFSDE